MKLSIALVFIATIAPLAFALQCMDDWTECNGAPGQRNTCSSDSCSVSMVPVPSCGSFMLRTCTVDYECSRGLSGSNTEFFNVKKIGDSYAYDYCCSGSDYCNNVTEAVMTERLCAWMLKNMPNDDLENPNIRQLCNWEPLTHAVATPKLVKQSKFENGKLKFYILPC